MEQHFSTKLGEAEMGSLILLQWGVLPHPAFPENLQWNWLFRGCALGAEPIKIYEVGRKNASGMAFFCLQRFRIP